MYLLPLNYTLKNDYNGKVHVYLPQLKKIFFCPKSKAEEGPITKPTLVANGNGVKRTAG